MWLLQAIHMEKNPKFFIQLQTETLVLWILFVQKAIFFFAFSMCSSLNWVQFLLKTIFFQRQTLMFQTVKKKNYSLPNYSDTDYVRTYPYITPMINTGKCLHVFLKCGTNGKMTQEYSLLMPLMKEAFWLPVEKKPFNSFTNHPSFLHVCSTSLLKTLWEKEKLLITSNFSFSPTVFYPFWEIYIIFIKLKIVICKLFQFGRVYNLEIFVRMCNISICCNIFLPVSLMDLRVCTQFNITWIMGAFGMLTLSQTSPGFYVPTEQVFWKHCGKRKIAHNEQFLLFPTVFSTCVENSAIFIKFESVVCKLFHFGRVKYCCLGKG